MAVLKVIEVLANSNKSWEEATKNAVEHASKSVKNIINLVEKNSWLLDVNKSNFQKKEFKYISEEIKNILPLIKQRGLKRLQKLLINL